MERSVTARFASRPAARFPRPTTGTRLSRLGLGTHGAFRPATARTTILRDQPSPLAHLRGDRRSIAATRPVRRSSGLPRPVVSPTWVRSVSARRPSAHAAPWRD
jgi:hypothetical protein